MSGRRYDAEFVRRAVSQVRKGRVPAALAHELGVDEALLVSWVEEASEQEDDARSDSAWGGEDEDRAGWYARQYAWRIPAAVIAASLLGFLAVAVPITLFAALFAAEWAREIPQPEPCDAEQSTSADGACGDAEAEDR